MKVDGRVASVTITAPASRDEMLRAFRELDDALLRLRFNHEDVGLVTLRTRGDAEALLAVDKDLAAAVETDWRAREIVLLVGRVLRRLDDTAKSFFAVIDRPGQESCFAGTLLELALAADRAYMLEADGVTVRASAMNGGLLPCAQGGSRLALRFLAAPDRTADVLAGAMSGPLGAADAAASGFATVIADEIDFADELRVAIEERISLSPDALTGMEQNLRFAGAESVESKIFGRLSAWQNWIFIRPNATGERGALTMYGKPERPQFDPRRT
jgi:benzoyl-CoA-dihydrodiol lyase